METESFEDLYNESLKKDKKLNKIETGKIIRITDKGEIFVDLGYKADGIVPKKEYSDNLEEDPRKEFKVGDSITCEVLKLNDGLGNVLLSYKNIKIKNQRELFAKRVSLGETFEGKVSAASDKGLTTVVDGYRVFIPMSLSGIRKDENKEDYVGKTISFEITEYKPEINRVIGSHKVVADRIRQNNLNTLWSEIEVNKTFLGKVKKLASYGAFIDLNGLTGLLHISEITYKKNASAENYFKLGDEVEVYVKSFDRSQNKIELGYNQRELSPWETINERYHEGDIVTAKVMRFTTFGLFASVENDIEGLVHISEISDEKISKPDQDLKLGDEVLVKILEINKESRKLKLSIKAAHADDWKKDVESLNGITYEVQE